MAEPLDEPLDPRVPEAFVAAEPIIGARERPRVDPAVVDPSAHRALHESGSLEGLDVFRRRGERHPVGRGELAHGVFALGEPLEHGAAGVVAEGAKDEVEPCLLMFNHVVEHIGCRSIVNRLVELIRLVRSRPMERWRGSGAFRNMNERPTQSASVMATAIHVLS